MPRGKWVAEKLMNIAVIAVCLFLFIGQDVSFGIVILALVTPAIITFRMLKGLHFNGKCASRDGMVNLIPVDFVSKAIIHLSRQKESLGQAFHLINPNPCFFPGSCDLGAFPMVINYEKFPMTIGEKNY